MDRSLEVNGRERHSMIIFCLIEFSFKKDFGMGSIKHQHDYEPVISTHPDRHSTILAMDTVSNQGSLLLIPNSKIQNFDENP